MLQRRALHMVLSKIVTSWSKMACLCQHKRRIGAVLSRCRSNVASKGAFAAWRTAGLLALQVGARARQMARAVEIEQKMSIFGSWSRHAAGAARSLAKAPSEASTTALSEASSAALSGASSLTHSRASSKSSVFTAESAVFEGLGLPVTFLGECK